MTKQISLLKKIGIGAVVGLASLVSGAEPSQPFSQLVPSGAVESRVRQELTSKNDANGNKSNHYVSTLGLSDPNTPVAGEWFRAYDIINKVGDKTTETRQAAFRPVYEFSGMQAIPTFFIESGESSQSAGSEFRLKAKDLAIVANLEERSSPDRAIRFGLGADYDFHIGDSVLTAKAGFDQVQTAKGTTNYFCGGGVLDTKSILFEKGRDRFGAFGRVAASESDTTNSALFNYGHVGDKDFGCRAFFRLDRNDAMNFTSATFNFLGAQKPRYLGIPKGWTEQSSYAWTEGARDNGGIFEPSIANNALNVERCPINWRSNGGWVYGLNANVTDNAGKRNESFRADLGYSFGELKVGSVTIRPGIGAYGIRSSSPTTTKNTGGVSGIVEIGKILGGDVILEASRSMSSDKSSETYFSANVGWRW